MLEFGVIGGVKMTDAPYGRFLENVFGIKEQLQFL